MDIATIVGLLAAFGSLIAMVTMEGSQVTALLLPAPMILVLGATLAVGLAGSTVKDTIASLKSIPKAFRGRAMKPQETIEQLVSYAEKARRDGLLSLEFDAIEAQDPFLTSALQNIADGTDGEELRILLEDEMATVLRGERQSAKWFKTLGGYAPTIGIIGTVVTLTHVLENLSTPEKLGPLIASAFIATLWGLLSANFLWLPIYERLTRLAELESERMTLILEGMLAIQQGIQPRLLAERLRAMVPPSQRREKSAGAVKGEGAGKDSKQGTPAPVLQERP